MAHESPAVSVCVCVFSGSSHGYYWSNAWFRGSRLESVQLQHSYQTFPILLPRSEYIMDIICKAIYLPIQIATSY